MKTANPQVSYNHLQNTNTCHFVVDVGKSKLSIELPAYTDKTQLNNITCTDKTLEFQLVLVHIVDKEFPLNNPCIFSAHSTSILYVGNRFPGLVPLTFSCNNVK